MGWGTPARFAQASDLFSSHPHFPNPVLLIPFPVCQSPSPYRYISWCRCSPKQQAKIESLSLENRGQRIQTLLSGSGKRERHGWGSGLLHYQAERVEGRWGGHPPPGSVFGRADNTEITGGGGRSCPRPSRTVVSGGRGQLLGLGTGMGEATDCKSCGKGRGAGARLLLLFAHSFAEGEAGGGLGLDTPCPPRYPLGDGCW